jgi:hypothetical protein
MVQVDTFLGSQRCALEIIVQHEVQAFSQHEFFNELIDGKWTRFALEIYVWRTIIPYVSLLTIFTTFLIIRADEIHQDLVFADGDPGPRNGTGTFLYCVQDAASWAQSGNNESAPSSGSDVGGVNPGRRIAEFVLQVAIVAIGCPFLLYKGWQSRRLKLRDLDTDENGNISHAEMLSFIYKNANFLLNIGAVAALFLALVARLRCDHEVEVEAEAVASVLLFSNLLIVLMPFRYIGELVITIYRMFVGDIFRFVLVFAILQLGFSLSVLLLARTAIDSSRFSGDSFGPAFLHLLWLSLGDNLSDVSDGSGLESRGLIMAIYIVWIVVSTVLLLNLLITMMSRTFNEDSEDIHRVWVFPFAALVLRIENRKKHTEDKNQKDASQHARKLKRQASKIVSISKVMLPSQSRSGIGTE